jgi:DNA-binding SARP family transcriptional activator
MRYRILGPLEILAGQRQIQIAAPKQRALLAVLLLNANQIISTDWLITYLWGERAPATATNLVRVYVSQLRRLLGSGGGVSADLLSTESPGYRLEVAAGELDLQEFDGLVAEAEAAMAAGQVDKAATHLHAALALWRGPALSDVPSDLLAHVDVPRLEERRLAALEARIDADLRLGRHQRLVGELGTLVALHPLRERLQGQFMLALYRAGRRADALQAYQRIRQDLIEEFGLDPSPTLQALQHAILTDDVSLQPPAREHGAGSAASEAEPSGAAPRSGAGAAQARDVPMQLPADIADFTGRAQDAAWLEQMLTSALDGRTTTVAIAVVTGTAGTGKTATAIRVAHRLRGRFPGGQLYVDLRGAEGQPLDPADVLGEFLVALGIDLATIPRRLDERSRTYRSLLARRRVLVVLDNAGSEAQVRPLLPGSAGCAALVTSRSQLAGLEAAQSLVLSVFEPEHATELLGRLAGQQRVLAEPEAASTICRLCGYLPLAVRIAGAKLAAKPHWTLAHYAGRLADERRRLGELVAGDLAVRLSVELSYRGLRPRESSALRLLGLVGASDFAAWMLAPLLDCNAEEADDLVEQLADTHLLEFAGQDLAGQLRYRFHDLLLVFARERLDEEQPEAARSAALARLLDAAVALSAHADSLLGPGRRGRGPLQPPGGMRWQLQEITKQLERDPHAWLGAERAQLVAAVTQAYQAQAWEAVWQLSGTLAAFLEQRQLMDDWQRTQELAVAAARQGGDPLEEAWALRNLGDLSGDLLRADAQAAQAHLEQALELFRRLGDRLGEAHALRDLGDLHADNARLDAAEAALTSSIALFRDLGDGYGEALTLLAFGQMVLRRRPGDAIVYLDACLPRLREYGDRRGAADAVFALGNAFYGRAWMQEAIEHFEQAMLLYREIPSPNAEGYASLMLGRSLLALGRCDEATVAVERALATGRERAARHLEGGASHALADCRYHDGRFDDAVGLYERCLSLVREFQDREGEAHVHRGLGNVARGAGRPDQALASLGRALELFRELDLPRGTAYTLQDLGDLYQQLGRLEDAADHYRQAIAIFDALEHRTGRVSARDRLATLPRSVPPGAGRP